MKYRRRVLLAAIVVAIVAAVFWRRHSTATSSHAAGAGPAERAIATHAVPQRELPGRRVAGTVLLDDSPASGALVRIDDAPPVRTDASGRFDLGVQPIARHVVAAESPHARGAFADIALADPATDAEHVVLVMHACTASLHGTIRDAAGGTIAHARIAMADGDDRLGAGVESADDGSYELCVAEGTPVIIVAADGYARTKARIVAAGRTGRDFLLVPEVPIAGRVVRAEDQAPVANAEVELRAMPPDGWVPLVLRATADGDGRFRIAGAPPGRHSLTARADHLATRNEVPVLAELGAPPEDVLVEVSPAVTIRGKVVSRGQPVAAAWIALAQRTFRLDQGAYSQRDGSFSIESVQPGHYTLEVTGYTLATAPALDVAQADVTGVVLDVAPMASVTGRVTHAGKAVEGASVQTDRASATTDATGRFTIHGLSPGAHQIYAESKRLGVFTHGPTITLAEAEQRTGVDIEMDLSASIAGTVVDQDGAPVSGVIVELSLLHGHDFGEASTADDGSFTATALSGGGSYVYVVQSADRSLTYPLADGRHLVSIAVRDGQTRITGVQIRIRRERKVIAGHVTTTAGAPVADAVVRAERRDRFFRMLPGVTTDVTGAFRFDDVPPGTYHVVATTPHAEESVDKVAAGRTDVAIQLPEPGTIDGTLEGFVDPPVVYASRALGAGWFQATVHGTAFVLRAIPPGEYEVMADGAKETVTLAPGGHAHVVLHDPGKGSIAGTLVDEHGAPLAGAQCICITGRSRTDAQGHFVCDDVPAGKQFVMCHGTEGIADADVAVVSGQTASVQLTAQPLTPHARTGMRLEYQLGQFVVSAVDPGGPADQAGIKVGDLIVSVEGEPLDMPSELERFGAGATVRLVLERDDKQLSVSLTLAAR